MVICAHGYSGNARDFDVLARELCADARVICIDVAGRGESDWLRSPMSYHFGQFLSDINALVATLGLKQVDWIGTSMGGLLGMLLASQPASPVRRLVMNDIGAFVPLDALQAIGRNLQSPPRFDTLADVEAHLRQTHSTWGEISDAQFQELAVHGSRKEGEGYRLHYDPQITRLLQPFPLAPGIFMWDAWYRVRCPVLLLRGETSSIFPKAVAQAMLAAKPAAALIEIPGCGHVPSLMEESQVEIVRNFVRAKADKLQWLQHPSSSSQGSSKTPTGSRTRSNGSGKRPPAPSPT